MKQQTRRDTIPQWRRSVRVRSFDITRIEGILGSPECLLENKHAILVCIYSAGFEAGRATSNIHRKSRQALFKRATKQTK